MTISALPPCINLLTHSLTLCTIYKYISRARLSLDFIAFSLWLSHSALFVLSIRLTLIKTHHQRVKESWSWTEMQSHKTNSIPHRSPSIFLSALSVFCLPARRSDDQRSMHYWMSWAAHTSIEMKLKNVTSLRVCSYDWRRAVEMSRNISLSLCVTLARNQS